MSDNELTKIRYHIKEAQKVKPLCPIHAAVALQEIKNLKQQLSNWQAMLEDGIEQNKR